ncbi:unnamed protein product [Ectocarpus sp. 12 AP-2014]
MKRDRDGSQHQHHYEYRQQWPQQQYQQHQNRQEEDIPPPPPPRNRPQQEIPPPPPPRIRPSSASRNGHVAAGSNGSSDHPPAAFAPATAAVSTASRTNGAGDGGGANVFTASSSSATAQSSSSTPTSSTMKRPKLGDEHPDNWRATADEVLVKAGLKGGGKEKKSMAGEEEASSTRRGNDKEKQQQPGATKTVAAARSKRRFAVVCSANFNRSMMAHKLLKEHNFQVESYGTGREVRLPGKDIASPEVFPFGTPYRDIFDKLKAKDEALFSQNNLLPLVARNAMVKAAPQRFQEIEGPDMADFDVVLCFETRVFHLVVEGTCSPESQKVNSCERYLGVCTNAVVKQYANMVGVRTEGLMHELVCRVLSQWEVLGVAHSNSCSTRFRSSFKHAGNSTA